MKILNISDAAALALHAMIVLASEPDRRFTLGEVTEILGVSEHHLSKVMQRLVKYKFITSMRGPSGGFKIKDKSLNSNFLDVLKKFEGWFEENPCFLGRDECPICSCVFDRFLYELNDSAKGLLERYRFKDMVGRKVRK